MKTISSRQNPIFKRVRAAIREHGNEIVLEGPKQVDEAIARGWRPLALLTRGATRDDAIAILPALFDDLAETKASQGVLALFSRPQYTLQSILARRETVAVALDGVQDPGNVGTIVRLAAAFDAGGIILLPGCADPYGPKAVRSSAGAVLSVPVAEATIEDVLRCGRPIFAADITGKAVDPPADNAILVLGSEGSGVSEAIRSTATLLTIETSGRIESLNVASAAAILLQRSFQRRASG
ncbi:MAG TPA: RNA methyltransferase [Thermoanaerobaculia bacterium]|nr:RNA methyltransferase [Thermoanaerobaculia bacterium]